MQILLLLFITACDTHGTYVRSMETDRINRSARIIYYLQVYYTPAAGIRVL